MTTREEAIRQLQSLREHCRSMARDEHEDGIWVQDIAALDLALSALHPVSREQVEQVWRSYWDRFSNGYADGYEVYDEWQCRKCGFEVETDGPETLPQFCPSCGAPMTGEAVDILLKRLEAQKDELSRLQAP